MRQNKQISEHKGRVLVVDDSRVMRKAISKILGGEFNLVEAEDGEDGWETLIKDDSIQIIIADIQMPRLDGYSMICRIRAADESRVRDVPIIVSTGADDDITRERAFACGANDFITKPIDPKQLVARVRTYFEFEEDSANEERAIAADVGTSVDPLTQLSGRRSFLERGEINFEKAKKKGEELSLMRIDIDRFEEIRSEYGDEIADQVLIWLGRILLYKTRKDHFVACTGSAKFSILAGLLGRMEAAVLCDRLRSAVSVSPFTQERISVPVTISIGLATLVHDPVTSIEQMYNIADRRVQIAKKSGGNRLIASHQEDGDALDEAVMEEPNVDTALEMLANNDAGKLGPYAPSLVMRVLPLLEFCNEQLGLGLDYEINTLKEKLTALK